MTSTFVILFLLIAAAFASPFDNVDDRRALTDLFSATNGPAWIVSSNWTRSDVTMCWWHGVTCYCTSTCRVVMVQLASNNLVGTLPPSLTLLTSIKRFDVYQNALTGPIDMFHDLNELQILRLGLNNFTGSFPVAITSLYSLEELDLCVNSLHGSVPNLSSLTALKVLGISDNFLNMSFPDWIGSMHALQHIFLADNNIFGPFPQSFGQLTSLNTLDICGNPNLGGSFPTCLQNMHQLEVLSVSSTNMAGSIPSWISNLTSLTKLFLSVNSLSGSLPDFSAMQNLQLLDVSANQLNGTIPESLARLPSLLSLNLASNKLSGSIPSFDYRASLLSIDISSNSLTGTIPASLGNLLHLSDLRLESNSLVGTIPPSILNSSTMQLLDLSSNFLSGQPLMNLGANFINIRKLSLHSNRFSGCIMTTGSKVLSQLQYLFIQSNAFSGSFPDSLSAMSKLKYLHAHQNQFESTFPAFIASLGQSLLEIRLSENKLYGTLPQWLVQLQQLEYLDLRLNNFTGPIVATLGNISSLTDLDLSHNSFAGAIPSSLGQLSHLRDFRADGNSLEGTVPDSFGALASLRTLKLSHNQLTGTFPVQLKMLTSLIELDISSNAFFGECNVVATNFVPSVINVSNNQFNQPFPLSNLISPNSALNPPSLFDASQNSFPCPYPLPPDQHTLFQRSSCRPEWNQFFQAGGIVLALLVSGMFVYFTVKNRFPMSLPKFRTIIFFVGWLTGLISLTLDFVSISEMLSRLNHNGDDCTRINSYVMFSSFMPFTLPQQERTIDPRQLFPDWISTFSEINLNTTFSFPVATGLSVYFVTDYSQEKLASPEMYLANINAFESLCKSVASCGLDSMVCTTVDPSAREYGSPSIRLFFWLVVIVALLRACLELCRAFIVVEAWTLGHWPHNDWSPDFAGESAMTPLLLLLSSTACRHHVYDVVVQHDTTHSDYLFRVLHRGLLQTLPMTCLNFVYFLFIVQTGISVSQSLSLAYGFILLPQLFFRAFRAWRSRDPSYSNQDLDSMLSKNQTDADYQQL